MKVIKAPEGFGFFEGYKVFLAGSIEMGKAEDWQTRLTNMLRDQDITILNPRRDDWDDTWEQKIEHPLFREQVEWELKAMEVADKIALYFSPGTFAPITLLEFGLHARSGKLIVCCPEGFYRKGNVDIVCARYNVRQVATIEELSKAIQK